MAMPYDFDVIVVGSGAGGATLATACARAGKSVLLLERGPRYVVERPAHDEHTMLIEKKPYDDRPIEVNGSSRRLYMGGVLGGGTALYGAALMRPSRDDFHPGKHYGNRIPRAIWDWPVGYDALEPHYAEAERLYGVSGDGGENFGPLQKPRDGFAGRPMPLHPINRKLIAANRARGLQPFQLPLAIDSSRCLGCPICPGYICVHGARHSSAQLLEQAVAEGRSLHVRTNAEVDCLSFDGQGNADGVCVRDRATGELTRYRARRYVLGAGAIGSPLILLRSGVAGPLIGRHYMPHLAPLVLGIFPRRIAADESFVKQVGFSDYYFGTRRFAHKLGLIQSLPVPGPLMMAGASRPRLPKRFIHFLRPRMLPLCGIVEDLPHPDNRVSWSADGKPRLRHSFGPYDLERGRLLGRLMARILKRAGAVFCVIKRFPSDEHVAHQCGTLRFGTDPAHAVLDPDCRLFQHPNVFVVDGSFFPTSLGVGPALTIMANALRVARIVAAEL
jgi:choline dehydrogenase-like flavoprotein